jgi:hypothetical protein
MQAPDELSLTRLHDDISVMPSLDETSCDSSDENDVSISSPQVRSRSCRPSGARSAERRGKRRRPQPQQPMGSPTGRQTAIKSSHVRMQKVGGCLVRDRLEHALARWRVVGVLRRCEQCELTRARCAAQTKEWESDSAEGALTRHRQGKGAHPELAEGRGKATGIPSSDVRHSTCTAQSCCPWCTMTQWLAVSGWPFDRR